MPILFRTELLRLERQKLWVAPSIGMCHIILPKLRSKLFHRSILWEGDPLNSAAYGHLFIRRSKNARSLELQISSQEGISVPINIILGFQQSEQQNRQELNKTFLIEPRYRMLKFYRNRETSWQWCSFKNSLIMIILKASTKIEKLLDILQPYLSHQDFRSSNEGVDIGFDL